MELDKAADDPAYCDKQKKLLADHGLGLWAISNHLSGQLVCDPNDDSRSDTFSLPRALTVMLRLNVSGR